MGCTSSTAMVAEQRQQPPSTSKVNNGEPRHMQSSGSRLRLDEMKSESDELQIRVVRMETPPLGKPIESVYDGVNDGLVLGEGVLGKVRLAVHKSTGVQYAVKCLDLEQIQTEQALWQLREEIRILCELDHPNVVRIESVFETETKIYLVQELCIGGELFDHLDTQPGSRFSEPESARLVQQMLSAVRYIHSKGIVHRDLKLENFLFSRNDPDSDLKMIDFGLAKHFNPLQDNHDVVGTPYTVAPEVIKGVYDERCDLWGVGVLTFLLLSGDAPFGGCYEGDDLGLVREAILNRSFAFDPPGIWNSISPEARVFIDSLLVTDPHVRPTAQAAQHAEWLQMWSKHSSDSSTLEDMVLSPEFTQALVSFRDCTEIEKLLREVLSFSLLPDQVGTVSREFHKLDTEGSGEISLFSLRCALMQATEHCHDSAVRLSEQDIEEIFNALRVRKTETTIHWHEFVAATLSQCCIDERNLKLAFDRLSNCKDHIALQDLTMLIGSSTGEENIQRMWSEALATHQDCQPCLTYAGFLQICCRK